MKKPIAESKEIRKHAGWYASYMQSEQGQALIECMEKRIEADDELVEAILGEIELADSPREEAPEKILNSIKGLLEERRPVRAQEGNFEWTG